MGNAQSGAGAGASQQAEQTRQIDYYELLEIDEDAGDDEIKVSSNTVDDLTLF